MSERFEIMLEKAETVGDVYNIVKSAVAEVLRRERAGLMLGFSELGLNQNGFVGAYHQMGSNLIVVNSTLLEKVQKTNPSLLKPHMFHLLLHEYLHSLGIVDEERTKALTYFVSKEAFGEEHLVTRIADNFEKFIPNMVYPSEKFKPPENSNITLIEEFDKENTTYIG